jgi:hypothetical protein
MSDYVRQTARLLRPTYCVIGSVSFAPMLLYTSYLFWLSHRGFISSLPPRHQSISKYLLIILIPVVVAANEVASFVGVSIRE